MTQSAACLSPSALQTIERRIIDWLSQVPLQSTTVEHEVENQSMKASGPWKHLTSTYAYTYSDHLRTPSSQLVRPRKRRASGFDVREDPISPPLTAVHGKNTDKHEHDKMQRTPSPKKRRVNIDTADPDMTPRAGQSTSFQPPVVFQASVSGRGSTSDASSQNSGTGTSSPRKQMAAMAADPDGMVRRLLRLGAEGMPKELADLYVTLDDCNNGFGVVTRAYEDSIAAEAARNPTLRPLPSYAFVDAAQRDAVGITPTIEEVLAVLSWADHSGEVGAQEAAWNGDVHSMLLKLAVHGGYHRRPQLVDVVNCTTASIIREYLPPSLPPKKVDFCIVLDPASSTDLADKAMAESIDRRRRTCPLSSINHTDLESLISRPIVISIETKRGGGSLEQGQLQAATWQSAQWNLLAKLSSSDGPENGRRRHSEVDDPLDSLPFLPAIIIQGHDWSLAATTRSGTKKVLWYDRPFGHTRDVLGIYKIVYGVQKLLSFSKDVFWPWYKDAILRPALRTDG